MIHIGNLSYDGTGWGLAGDIKHTGLIFNFLDEIGRSGISPLYDAINAAYLDTRFMLKKSGFEKAIRELGAVADIIVIIMNPENGSKLGPESLKKFFWGGFNQLIHLSVIGIGKNSYNQVDQFENMATCCYRIDNTAELFEAIGITAKFVVDKAMGLSGIPKSSAAGAIGTHVAHMILLDISKPSDAEDSTLTDTEFNNVIDGIKQFVTLSNLTAGPIDLIGVRTFNG